MTNAIYHAHLMDHARHPRNKRVIEDATVMQRGSNPSCGDSITLYMRWSGDTLEDVSFEGSGCAVSQACASLLTEKLKGMTREDALRVTDADMYDLLKVEIHGSREKCALLALHTLRDAMRSD